MKYFGLDSVILSILVLVTFKYVLSRNVAWQNKFIADRLSNTQKDYGEQLTSIEDQNVRTKLKAESNFLAPSSSTKFPLTRCTAVGSIKVDPTYIPSSSGEKDISIPKSPLESKTPFEFLGTLKPNEAIQSNEVVELNEETVSREPNHESITEIAEIILDTQKDSKELLQPQGSAEIKIYKEKKLTDDNSEECDATAEPNETKTESVSEVKREIPIETEEPFKFNKSKEPNESKEYKETKLIDKSREADTIVEPDQNNIEPVTAIESNTLKTSESPLECDKPTEPNEIKEYKEPKLTDKSREIDAPVGSNEVNKETVTVINPDTLKELEQPLEFHKPVESQEMKEVIEPILLDKSRDENTPVGSGELNKDPVTEIQDENEQSTTALVNSDTIVKEEENDSAECNKTTVNRPEEHNTPNESKKLTDNNEVIDLNDPTDHESVVTNDLQEQTQTNEPTEVSGIEEVTPGVSTARSAATPTRRYKAPAKQRSPDYYVDDI